MTTQRSRVRIKIGSFGKDGHWATMQGATDLSEQQIEVICESLKELAKFGRENPEGNNGRNAVSVSSSATIWRD